VVLLNGGGALNYNNGGMISGFGGGIGNGDANALYGKGSFLNDISIEGIDDQGRVTLKSLTGRDSTASMENGGSGLKWKRKSELSRPIESTGKSRISIKGNN
jgi:hypothetical protein